VSGRYDRIDYRFLLWTCIGAMVAAVIALSLGTAGAYLVSVVSSCGRGGFLPLLGVMFHDYFRGVEFGRAIGYGSSRLNATTLAPGFAARMRDLTGSSFSRCSSCWCSSFRRVSCELLARRHAVGAARRYEILGILPQPEPRALRIQG